MNFARVFLAVYILLAFNGALAQSFKTLSSSESGFNFLNKVTESDSLNIYIQKFPYMSFSGAGLSIADFDKDGLDDILMLGNQIPSKLFKNKGRLKFEDVTAQSGIKTTQWTNASTVADINNDGLLDIFITKLSYPDSSFAGNLLYINKGNFKFEEKSKEYGLHYVGNSIHAAFFDYDNDGFMDLYLINQPLESFAENTFDIFNQTKTYGQSDILYHNESGKRFVNVNDKAGLKPENAFGLSVVTADFNQDELTDIYVCNDYVHSDFLYINNGNGTFTERLADFFDHTSLFTMGSAFTDLNNDALPDLVTLDMNPPEVSEYKVSSFEVPIDKYAILTKNHFRQEVRNVMQLNRGNNHFSEIGQMTGLAYSDWSWAVLGEDFDNDGNRDIYISNGLVKDVLDKDFLKYSVDSALRATGISSYRAKGIDLYKIAKMSPRRAKNQLNMNKGNLNFELAENSGTSQTWVTTSAASADLDNDGDLDLVLGNSDTTSVILENTSISQNYLTIKFDNPNQAWNAKVYAYCGNKTYFSEITNTQGILCNHTPEAHFGLGKTELVDSLAVRLSNGKIFRSQNVKSKQILTLKPQDFNSGATIAHSQVKTIFKPSALSGFDYTHTENDFNDLKKETLLPHQLNAFGPYAAVGDLDGNTLDDIIIGGSAGTAAVLYFQQTDGSMKRSEQTAFMEDAAKEDAGITLFDADADKDLDILIVSGGNENFPDSSYYQSRLYLNDSKGNFFACPDCLPKQVICGSEAVAFDMDKDGDMDIFLGGRNLPGLYPKSPRSALLRNDKGMFTDITPPQLLRPGMVTSVASADFDNNGFPDLAIAGEWMPVLMFWNEKGMFSLPDTLLPDGFWQHLNVGNLNGDNLPDLVVGNLGQNTRFSPRKGDEIRVYATDIDDNGTFDPLVCTMQEGSWKPVMPYEKVVKEIPSLRKKFLRLRTYRDATIQECLGSKVGSALMKKCSESSSFTLINGGKRQFAKHKEGFENQLSPISTSLIHNFDGKDSNDILAHGNFLENAPEIGPMDANDGLFLTSTKETPFKAVPRNAGFQLKGNVRKMYLLKTVKGEKIIVLKNGAKAEVWEYSKGN